MQQHAVQIPSDNQENGIRFQMYIRLQYSCSYIVILCRLGLTFIISHNPRLVTRNHQANWFSYQIYTKGKLYKLELVSTWIHLEVSPKYSLTICISSWYQNKTLVVWSDGPHLNKYLVQLCLMQKRLCAIQKIAGELSSFKILISKPHLPI